MITVTPGLDRVLTERPSWLRHARYGLLTCGAAVTRDLTPAPLALAAAGHAPAILFAPEHGIWADRVAGAPVPSAPDPVTGLPVESLYGPNGPLDPHLLDGLDLVVADLPDIGVRYYTYAATLFRLLDLAAATHTPVVVLDRPNPLGGLVRQGPGLLPPYRSLVGALNVPVRHGLTLGELARLYARLAPVPPDLTVVPCLGWTRPRAGDATGLPFVPPSPNTATLEMVQLYPGTCLIEGTNVSEGRGTALPFRVVGAPWIAGRTLWEALRALPLPGIGVRPVAFVPTAHKYAGQRCEGVACHVLDPEHLDAFAFGVTLLATLRALYPASFTCLSADEPEGHPPLDLLAGGPALRQGLEAGMAPDALLARLMAAQPPLPLDRTLWLYEP